MPRYRAESRTADPCPRVKSHAVYLLLASAALFVVLFYGVRWAARRRERMQAALASEPPPDTPL